MLVRAVLGLAAGGALAEAALLHLAAAEDSDAIGIPDNQAAPGALPARTIDR